MIYFWLFYGWIQLCEHYIYSWQLVLSEQRQTQWKLIQFYPFMGLKLKMVNLLKTLWHICLGSCRECIPDGLRGRQFWSLQSVVCIQPTFSSHFGYEKGSLRYTNSQTFCGWWITIKLTYDFIENFFSKLLQNINYLRSKSDLRSN